LKEEHGMIRNEEMICREDSREARLYAAERCMTLMEEMINDFEELMIAYSQFSLYVGNEVCNQIRMLQEVEDDEDERKFGAIVVYPKGSSMEYLTTALAEQELFADEIIEQLGGTELLFSYDAQEVVEIDGRKYLDGAMAIFKTDPEGELLPLGNDELLTARVEAMKLVRRIRIEGEYSFVFALEQEGV